MLALVASVSAIPACAQESVFLIRHAERAEGENPPITEAGRERAFRWAEMLSGAGITKVFTSEARRTRETGAIIAEALGVEVEALPTGNTQALLDMMERDHGEDRVLAVGHTETIPGILTALGVFDLVSMPKDDYARLFVVVTGSADPVVLDMRMP